MLERHAICADVQMCSAGCRVQYRYRLSHRDGKQKPSKKTEKKKKRKSKGSEKQTALVMLRQDIIEGIQKRKKKKRKRKKD